MWSLQQQQNNSPRQLAQCDPIPKVVWYYGHHEYIYQQMAARGILLRKGLAEDLEHNFPSNTSEGQTASWFSMISRKKLPKTKACWTFSLPNQI